MNVIRFVSRAMVDAAAAPAFRAVCAVDEFAAAGLAVDVLAALRFFVVAVATLPAVGVESFAA